MKKKLMSLLTCLIMCIGLVTAQTSTVTGVVISEEDGQPVVGASILVVGTNLGTITDIDGNFALSNVPSSAKTLQVSFIGMQTEQVSIRPNLRIVLRSDSQLIDEVVVVAYGTQSSKAVTASISSVRSDALKDVPSVSFDQMLQGRAAGINVTTPSGAVGQAPVVNIRGIGTINSGSTPLYVVDGMPINTDAIGNVGGETNTSGTQIGGGNPLSDINPADILSIDVLKDAAATAMYGSRAANGVILITTKRGAQGTAKVSYDMNVGFSNRTKFPKLMNATEYVDFKNMAWKNFNGPESKGPFYLQYDSKGNLIDTNWEDLIFRNGVTQNHTLSVSGANNKLNYYMSANYSETDGIVIGDHYDRLGIRANSTLQATEWLKIGMNVNYSESITENTDAARNGSTFASGGFPRLALILSPNIPAYNEDGTPYYYSGSSIGYAGEGILNAYMNPMAIYEYGNGVSSEVKRMIGTVFLEVTPVKGLALKTQYGIDNSVVEIQRFWNPYHGDGFNSKGVANAYHQNYKLWTWTNTATYDVSIDNHNLNLLLGMEANQTKYNYWGVQGSGLNDFEFSGIETNYASYSKGGGIYERSMVSYFGRINYDYKFKYMLSANMRRDGYSPLGNDSRWGNFGGVSGAWRISEENFFAGIKSTVNDLKLKLSWGGVGNANVGYYPAKSFFAGSYYGENPTYVIDNVGDSKLKWESSNTFDVGLSMRLLNNINIDIDYYNTTSSDLILKVPQAPSAGLPYAEITTNAGKMRNQGVEFTISADILKNKTFNWNSSFNITVNKNKVIKLSEPILSSDYSGMEQNNITVEGKSIGQLYLYRTGGIDQATGRRVFFDDEGRKMLYNAEIKEFVYENGSYFDDEENELLMEMCGNTLPIWYGGWSNNFTYKNFDLNIFFQFSGGNKIYNGTKATQSDMRFWNNSHDVMKNHWTETNRNASYVKPVYGDNVSNGSLYPLSDLVEKGDYLRLKNISLGYTFNTRNWNSKLGISSLRLYAQAQNLFVITGYSGLDPEVLSNTMSTTLAAGVDKNTLPQTRTYTFGLNITF